MAASQQAWRYLSQLQDSFACQQIFQRRRQSLRLGCTQDKAAGVFLLGAAPDAVTCAATRAQQRVDQQAVQGWVQEWVVDTYSPPFEFETDPTECQRIVQLINQSGATVLAMGVGVSQPEAWIERHREKLPAVREFVAFGEMFDSGKDRLMKVPDWVSEVGLAWLYRLLYKPS